MRRGFSMLGEVDTKPCWSLGLQAADPGVRFDWWWRDDGVGQCLLGRGKYQKSERCSGQLLGSSCISFYPKVSGAYSVLPSSSTEEILHVEHGWTHAPRCSPQFEERDEKTWTSVACLHSRVVRPKWEWRNPPWSIHWPVQFVLTGWSVRLQLWLKTAGRQCCTRNWMVGNTTSHC